VFLLSSDVPQTSSVEPYLRRDIPAGTCKRNTGEYKSALKYEKLRRALCIKQHRALSNYQIVAKVKREGLRDCTIRYVQRASLVFRSIRIQKAKEEYAENR